MATKIKDVKPEYDTMPGGILEQKMSWNDMKIAIAKIRPIKLKGMDVVPEGTTLKDFIKNFVVTWRKDKDTVFVDDGQPQCRLNALRSLGDIVRLCQYYFPDTGVIPVRKALTELVYEGVIKFSICGTIHKRVYSIGRHAYLVAGEPIAGSLTQRVTQEQRDIYFKQKKDEFGYGFDEEIEIKKRTKDDTISTDDAASGRKPRKTVSKNTRERSSKIAARDYNS